MRRPFTAPGLITLLGAGIIFAAAAPEHRSEKRVVPIRVACVGDSITFGSRIKAPGQSYPVQLGDMLGNRYEVRNFGVKGTTVLRKAKHWRGKEAFEFQPNMVIILLGTNDSKEEFWKHKADFESDYISLIRRFQGLESSPRILICYPVPCYKDIPIRDKVIAREIIPMIAGVAHKANVEVVDLYTPLDGRKELFADGVHPNRDGATVIAETVRTAILGPQENGPGD